MEEDSDEKIRRNLIVASVAISLGAWLDLPALIVVKRILGEDATAVQSWRLWVAVLVVLVYLIFRYKFSNGARHSWDVVKNEWHTFLLEAMSSILSRQVNRFTRKGIESPAFHKEISTYIRSRTGERERRPQITVTHVTHEILGTGHAQLTLKWPNEIINPNKPLGFELAKLNIIEAKIFSFFRLLVYSHSSTSFFVPVFMGFAAITLSSWRLTVELLR